MVRLSARHGVRGTVPRNCRNVQRDCPSSGRLREVHALTVDDVGVPPEYFRAIAFGVSKLRGIVTYDDAFSVRD
jgi:hypothetical protein